MPNEKGTGASVIDYKVQKKREKEASNAAKSDVDIKKLKYDSIPFKNVEIDRMNSQRLNFE